MPRLCVSGKLVTAAAAVTQADLIVDGQAEF
jgi:hypothetical protein